MSKDNTTSRLSPAQISQLANAKPRGKRPQYFADPMSEQTHSMCMALMAELASARERIDTLERLLVSKGTLAPNDVDEYVPDTAAGNERQRSQVEYCARILRPLQQQVEAMSMQRDLTMDELADQLGQQSDSEHSND